VESSDILAKLPNYKHDMFKDIFKAVDEDENGKISVKEMGDTYEIIDTQLTKDVPKYKKFMHSYGDKLTLDEFMGVMAVCEAFKPCYMKDEYEDMMWRY